MATPSRASFSSRRWARLGVAISVDDFGAGYTSLGQLKDLPVSELKVDRSFVTTMTEDRSNALIVHSVVDLGHNLGLTIVAEVVETAEALTALAGVGCDVAQGYHLARPMPVDAFDTWAAVVMSRTQAVWAGAASTTASSRSRVGSATACRWPARSSKRWESRRAADPGAGPTMLLLTAVMTPAGWGLSGRHRGQQPAWIPNACWTSPATCRPSPTRPGSGCSPSCSPPRPRRPASGTSPPPPGSPSPWSATTCRSCTGRPWAPASSAGATSTTKPTSQRLPTSPTS